MYKMGTTVSPVNITRNCTFDHVSNNSSLCKFNLSASWINEMEHPGHINKSLYVGNMSEMVEDEFEKSMEMVFEVGLLTIFGVVGVIGNVAGIILFARLQVQLKFHRLMIMLCTYDTVYILLNIWLFALPKICTMYEKSGAHHFVLPRVIPFAQIALTGSIYSTLAITVERYIIVCHPFYVISHQWSTKRYIIPIVIFSMLYNAPKFFELKTSYDQDLQRHYVDATEMRINPYYYSIYNIWMNFLFMGLGPFLVLISLNGLTLRSLSFHLKLQPPSSSARIEERNKNVDLNPTVCSLNDITKRQSVLRSNGNIHDTNDLNINSYQQSYMPSFGTASTISINDRQSSLSSSKKNEIALAKVSLAIVLIFILCHSVRWIPNVYELVRIVRGQKEDWPTWIESLTHISHFLTTLNSSVNFYIYCFKHFSKSTHRLLRKDEQTLRTLQTQLSQ